MKNRNYKKLFFIYNVRKVKWIWFLVTFENVKLHWIIH